MSNYDNSRRYACTHNHRKRTALLACWFPKANLLNCSGSYAVLSLCNRPGERAGIVRTVTTWPSMSRAIEACDWIDRGGCGGGCSKQHEIVHFPELDGLR